jgi:hypothetical protein
MSPIFTRDIQRTLLWIPKNLPLFYLYRAITLYGASFQRTSSLIVRE